MSVLPSPPYLAAAVQFEPRFGDKAGNVARLLELTDECFRRGARLVVHPEMATTGYTWTGRAEIAPYVEPIPGPTVEQFADLARRHDGWIVVGLPEVDPANGGFYNSAALIGPAGLAGAYRKSHPYVTEVRWARDGDVGLPVFDTPLGRLGILICMDAEYPESSRVLALAGCDVVCFPTNWLSEKSPSAYWIQRAWENGTYWVCANRVGLERGIQFSGGSAILGPEGEVLASLDDRDGIVLARVDPTRAAEARARRLAARRPPLYQAMTLNSYLWPGVHNEKTDDAGALEGLSPVPSPTAIRIAVESGVPEPDDALAVVERHLISRPADLVVLPPFRPGMAGSADASSSLGLLATKVASTAESMTKMSETHHCMIAMGGPLADGPELFDAVMLALPDGKMVVHLNTHPSAGRDWAVPASQEPPVIRTAFGLVGLLTGDELLLPELARGLSVRGTEFAVTVAALDAPLPTGLPATQVPLTSGLLKEDPLHWFLPRVRAAENNMWLVFANNGALPSGIFGPSFYRSPRREAVTTHGLARIDLAADHADRDRLLAVEKPYLRMRPAHLYRTLTTPGGPHGRE